MRRPRLRIQRVRGCLSVPEKSASSQSLSLFRKLRLVARDNPGMALPISVEPSRCGRFRKAQGPGALLVAQRVGWVQARNAQSGNQAGAAGYQDQAESYAREGDRVCGCDAP